MIILWHFQDTTGIITFFQADSEYEILERLFCFWVQSDCFIKMYQIFIHSNNTAFSKWAIIEREIYRVTNFRFRTIHPSDKIISINSIKHIFMYQYPNSFKYMYFMMPRYPNFTIFKISVDIFVKILLAAVYQMATHEHRGNV